MADDVEISAGSGTPIATDDCTSGHVQLVKLAYGANGNRTHVDADANGLKVQLGAAVPAGSAKIGGVDLDSDATPGSAVPAAAQYVAGTDGTNARGLKTDAAGELQIDVLTLPALPAGNNNVGDVDIASAPDALGVAASVMNASSSDGATALTNSAQVIKASAGVLRGYFIFNPNAATAFVQFYNTAAASVTVGTTNPLFMLAIPGGSAANLWMQPGGVNFSNAGWSWAATSTAGGNGALTTALDAVAFYN